MRYSMSGFLGVGTLEDVMRHCIDDLAQHDVDEVSSVSIYLTPRSRGRRVDFRSPQGAIIDHVKLDPVVPRTYAPPTNVLRRDPVSRSGAVVYGDMAANMTVVSQVMASWRLDLIQMAAMLDSDQVRLAGMLQYQKPKMLPREYGRLCLLYQIDTFYDALEQPVPIAEWLRAEAGMVAFPGEMLFDQLVIHGDAALVRLRDALCALDPGRTGSVEPVVLSLGFDAILDRQ